jgi:hypothetical protein
MIAYIGQDNSPAADPTVKADRNSTERFRLIFDQGIWRDTMLTAQDANMIAHQRVIADPHISQYPIAANVHEIAQFDAGFRQDCAGAYRYLLAKPSDQMFE